MILWQVVMNKSAETAVYMAELEARALYNPRNPAGPLPTSLRPALNAALDEEGVQPAAARDIFAALAGAGGGDGTRLSAAVLERAFAGAAEEDGSDARTIDYYGFLRIVGKTRVEWPRY